VIEGEWLDKGRIAEVESSMALFAQPTNTNFASMASASSVPQ
jgi:hypothetical protein